MVKILAIIPAREGSKGIKDKNVQPLCNKPLVYWSISEARKAAVDRVIVSTDSQRYKDMLEQYGQDLFPFIRPEKYAKDSSPSSDVIIHALDKMKELGEEYDTFVLLEPTCPLRTAEQINEALHIFKSNKAAKALQSMKPVRIEQSAGEYYELTGSGFIRKPGGNADFGDSVPIRRQAAKELLQPCAHIYIAKSDWYRKHKTFVSPESLGFVVRWWESLEIDDEPALKCNEALMKWRTRR